MTMNETISEAWVSTKKRYMFVRTTHLEHAWVFDDKTLTFAFGPARADACDQFIEGKCAQAVIDALREAGYLAP